MQDFPSPFCQTTLMLSPFLKVSQLHQAALEDCQENPPHYLQQPPEEAITSHVVVLLLLYTTKKKALTWIETSRRVCVTHLLRYNMAF